MRPILLWSLAGVTVAVASALGVRQALADHRLGAVEADLLAPEPAAPFSEADVAGLPEAARRYLRHAITPGTPLAPACRLAMDGTMVPSPGRPPTDLRAVETLAPRRGFVWTASARMGGLPVRVRDAYHAGRGGVEVTALGVVPIPLGGPAADVARSARGRLVAEAVWCPTALVHPAVTWEDLGPDRTRFTLAVDGEPVAVTLRLGADGALREVALDRWGDADGGPWRALPYGFAVEAEAAFDGVTIPTRLVGGWHYGTDRFDAEVAASFTVHHAALAGTSAR